MPNDRASCETHIGEIIEAAYEIYEGERDLIIFGPMRSGFLGSEPPA
jgi:hypothetical protein